MMDWSDSLTLPKKEETDSTVEIEIPFDLLQYLSSESSIQNLCRICLLVQQNMNCLFTSNPALHEMLSAISSVRAQVEDGLPSRICEVCEAQLISCYKFKRQCDKSEFTLKSLLKGEFSTLESTPKGEFTQDEEILDKLEKCADKTTVYLIENNEQSDFTTKNCKDNTALTQENEVHEDVQYLEAFSDELSGAEILYADKEKKQHKKSSSENVYACAHCSKTFKSRKALGAHISKLHTEAKGYPCSHCKEVFNSDHDLTVHSALHDRTHPAWKCNQCSKEFKARSMLRRHIYRHMEWKRFSCQACGKAFVELYALRRHARVHTGEQREKKHQCHVCNKRSMLRRHIYRHMEWKRFSCQACGKAFVELYALRRHARVHTGEQREKKHQCHVCNKRYSESSLLSAHMSSHSGEKPWQCPDCSKQFATARLLTSHRLVHSSKKPYACQYCERRFRHESTRNTHHRTHTGEKPYVCAACGKAFIQNSNLRLHMRTHTGERPYACTQCSRRFTSSSSLKNHTRTHNAEEKIACELCANTGKKYSRTSLRAHVRLHAALKPFECGACRKRFLTPARLRNHYRMHTGEKPFECSICTQRFSTKSQLRQHLKQHDKEGQKRNKKQGTKIAQKKDASPAPEEVNYTIDEDRTPLETTGEIVVTGDNILVVDNSEINVGLQNGNICLEGVTYVQNDDINLVAVNDGGGVNISSASTTLQGSTVNLYQIDQSLVQIHSTGAQVTISKITSKMTTNFQ